MSDKILATFIFGSLALLLSGCGSDNSDSEEFQTPIFAGASSVEIIPRQAFDRIVVSEGDFLMVEAYDTLKYTVKSGSVVKAMISKGTDLDTYTVTSNCQSFQTDKLTYTIETEVNENCVLLLVPKNNMYKFQN